MSLIFLLGAFLKAFVMTFVEFLLFLSLNEEKKGLNETICATDASIHQEICSMFVTMLHYDRTIICIVLHFND